MKRSCDPSENGDASFSTTSMQWHSAIHAIVFVSELRKSACQQGFEGPEQLQSETQTTQDGPPSFDHDGTPSTPSQASQNEATNQAPQLDPKAVDKTLEGKNPEVEVLKQIRDELVKQMDAYGLVLVLLAGITFVAILQPPGSYDNGKLQESLLVSLFLLLATISFFIACTGLGAVMVGCAYLYQPIFYPKLAKYLAVRDSTAYVPALNSRPSTETPVRRGFSKWLLGCCEISPSCVACDNIDVLAKLCAENVSRIMRIRIYLGVALVLCIAAYICGALAVMVTNNCQRYLLVGALGAGGVILIFEICITVSAYMKPELKSSDGRPLQPGLHQQVRYLRPAPHQHAITAL